MIKVLLCLLFITTISAFNVDFEPLNKYKQEIAAQEEKELDKTFNMFLDAAGFEELFASFGEDLKAVYQSHLERALILYE